MAPKRVERKSPCAIVYGRSVNGPGMQGASTNARRRGFEAQRLTDVTESLKAEKSRPPGLRGPSHPRILPTQKAIVALRHAAGLKPGLRRLESGGRIDRLDRNRWIDFSQRS